MNNSNRLLSALLLITLGLTAMAQQKKFTHDDLQAGGKTYAKMTPESLSARWWGHTLVGFTNSGCVTYDLSQLSQTAEPCTNQKEIKTGGELFSLATINKALREGNLDTLRNLRGLTFPVAGETQTFVTTPAHRTLIDWSTTKVVWTQPRPKDTQAEEWNSVSRHLAYVKDHNLFVRTATGENRQVTTDGSRELVYAQSVHRNEWGISKGTFWSPDGQRLAFYRMDQSMVTDYPQVNIGQGIATCEPDKYPMAGTASHEVGVGIYDVVAQSTIWLDLGEKKDHYFTGVAWAPDNKTIYVTVLNRRQNHDEMWSFSALTGQRLNKVYEEDNDKYVHPEHAPLFVPWDESLFVYQTPNEGYSHIYLFNTDGRRLRDLTPGNYEVTAVLGFSMKDKSGIEETTECHDLQHNIYAIDLETGRRTLLDNGQGVHHGTLSPDGTMILDMWSSPEVKRQYDVLSTTRRTITPLLRPADPWAGYAVPTITGGTLKAADDTTDLYYRLITPPDFDPTRKYPAIVYVYGGPHTRLVNASWGYQYRGWEIFMAQQGYVVFAMDNRGSNERGLAFENVTYRHLGEVEMQDQMRGVQFLKSLPYVDADRLGVHGWSFGGFMTTNLMLTYPDVFKVGVAGGPVIDWSLYEVMYGERYMGPPQDNTEGYRQSNLCLKAGNLKGRLKIIFGYNDPVCVPQHTLSFARACADAGVQIDLFTYPGSGHNMTGHDRVHLHQQITQYFDDFLKP